MPRRSYNDGSVVATFTEDYRSTQKAKYMAPRSVRLASHDKTRVAYFHDEGVGNYHYGVSYAFTTTASTPLSSKFINFCVCVSFTYIVIGAAPNETSSINAHQPLGTQIRLTQEDGDLSTSTCD